MVDNKEQLFQLIKNSNSITWDDIKWLDQLVNSFPYFQSVKTLIAKKYLKEGHLLQTKKINIASTYSLNRKILRERLMSKSLYEEQVVTEDDTSSIDTVTVSNELKTDDTFHQENNTTTDKLVQTSSENDTLDDEKEDLVDTVEKINSEEENKDAIKLSFTPVKEDENDSDINPADSKSFERDKLLNAINKRLEELDKLKEESKEEEESSTESSSDSTQKEVDSIIEKEDKKPVTRIKNKKASSEKVTQKQSKIINQKVNDKDIFYSRLGNVLEPESGENLDLLLRYLKDQKDSKKKNKFDKQKIVQSFIKEEPVISKLNISKNKDQVISQDLSKLSSDTSSKLVSENLAKINAKQGNNKKAIDIYKQLILKYPQKKTYFAEQIEKLK